VPSHTVYLSLGSNLGDRANNLREAIAALAGLGVRVLRTSSLYETEPVDYLDQPWFLNCALQVETELDPVPLLRGLRLIEIGMGNQKPIPKGPRLIDIDILLFDDQTLNTPELQIPHPRMLSRRFVLTPLAEIAHDLRHPSWVGTVQQRLARTLDSSQVRLWPSRRDDEDSSPAR
jgi:2-amino-4-hydroxy-6-hydroxymethyldihydropteridine diphosphokinase